MFNNTFLEDAIANKNKRQQLDNLLRITAPHERIILAGIGLVLLALSAWALFGSVTRSITLDGVLVKPGNRHEIVTTEPGYLAEYLSAPGDRVEAGGTIARQSVPELDRETAALHNRVNLLESEIRQSGGDDSALSSLLASAKVALLQMEALRSARELITSQSDGEIMALLSAPGEYLAAGTAVALLRDGEQRSPQAVIRVDPQVAHRIQIGMRASIEVVMPDGALRRLDGEVTSVTPGPLPNWLVVLPPAVTGVMHRVDVAFRQASVFSVPDGTPCRIRIILDSHPPAALFNPGQP